MPSFTRPGGFTVATPQVSDIPHSSPIGIPIAWKNSSTSSGVGRGADVDGHDLVEPELARSFENISSSAWPPSAASSSGTSSPACSSAQLLERRRDRRLGRLALLVGQAARGRLEPAFSFSQIRGTAKNQVGRTSGRNSMILRGSGQIVIENPRITGR